MVPSHEIGGGVIDRVLSGLDRWTIVHAENLAAMRAMPPRSVHLVFGDAPFNTGEDFFMKDGRLAYSDRWPSLDAFVEHIRERCAAARDLLTEDGTLVVQVDPETSHYVKVALDGVFGRDCFRNEIVWRYRRWPVAGADFQRMHDTLLRYTRSPKAERWNQLYEPRSASTLETWGEARVVSRLVDGKRVTERTDKASPGAPMSDVWEIGILAPIATERVYPTQKPPELADRVVLSCSHPGDVVLDPWCGSGTTVVRAVANGRRGIGMDQSPVAVEIARARIDGPLFAAVGSGQAAPARTPFWQLGDERAPVKLEALEVRGVPSGGDVDVRHEDGSGGIAGHCAGAGDARAEGPRSVMSRTESGAKWAVSEAALACEVPANVVSLNPQSEPLGAGNTESALPPGGAR